MLDITLEKNRDLFIDFKKGLEYLRNVDESQFSFPKEVVHFHLYSEVRNPMQLMSVKSFFATQTLARTKLVLWSDFDVRDNQLLRPYNHLIDFRVFDPIKLAKGTPLQGKRKVLLAKDKKHYMQSGLLRFLAPYKMGGVWFDMDMILLRDLRPILDQEFAYQWGAETDFSGFGPCAAFMNINRESEHATICLEELAKAPIVADSVSRDHAMLKEVYKRRSFTVFPATFFNTEWLVNRLYEPLGTQIDTGWFRKNDFSSFVFPEAFAWHWHNGGGSAKVSGIEAGSKFDLITQIIDEKLRQRGFDV